MTDKLINFPISWSELQKNIDGPLCVRCRVSGRSLQFYPRSDNEIDGSELIGFDVMSSEDDEKPTRKLCSIVVKREDLLNALKHIQPKIQ